MLVFGILNAQDHRNMYRVESDREKTRLYRIVNGKKQLLKGDRSRLHLALVGIHELSHSFDRESASDLYQSRAGDFRTR